MALCLAGALSFNLASPESDDNTPVFAQLMLDEAFSKSDPQFAQQTRCPPVCEDVVDSGTCTSLGSVIVGLGTLRGERHGNRVNEFHRAHQHRVRLDAEVRLAHDSLA